MMRRTTNRLSGNGLRADAMQRQVIRPWHFLYFFPLPHGHGSFRPGSSSTASGLAGRDSCC